MAEAASLVRRLLQQQQWRIASSLSVGIRRPACYNLPFCAARGRGISTETPPPVAPVNSVTDAEGFVAEEEGPPPPEDVTLDEADGPALSSGPRVANLPEDLTAEQLAALAEKGEQPGERERKRLDSGEEPAEEEEAEPSYPKLVKVAQVKPRNPVVLADAVREVKALARARFDETLEAHVRLGVDPRRSDQTVRGAATLPHGSGKFVRVAVFAQGAAAEEAEAAGADVVGADELVEQVQESGGKLGFDKCIATPAFMPKLGRVARILGPRGLMPNPKVGTVTQNVGEAVRAAKRGRVDFRADKTGIVHAGLGKVSFKDEALIENIAAFAGALLAAKPAGLKKTSRYAGYVNSFVITSTMGAGVRVSLQSLVQAADNFSKSSEVR